MTSLRVIYDNVADVATSVAASTTAGSTAAANVQNDYKGVAHRSTGTTIVFTFTWTGGTTIDAAYFMTNLSAAATGRLQLFSDTACTAQIGDTGTVSVAAGVNISLYNWTNPLDVNAFAYGGITKSALWLAAPVANVKGAKLTLTDGTNPAGYIDTARIGMGTYWESPYNPTSTEAIVVDTTTTKRNDAGDNMSDRGTIHDQLAVELRALSSSDRATLMKIARHSGKFLPLFVSVFPGHSDAVLEQDHMIYGKFSTDAGVPEDFYQNFIHKRTVEGW